MAEGSRARRLRPSVVWLGFLLFGLGNFLLLYLLAFGGLESASFLAGLVLFGVLAALVAVLILVGARSLGIGIAAGYVFMTLVSGGSCTLFVGYTSELLTLRPPISTRSRCSYPRSPEADEHRSQESHIHQPCQSGRFLPSRKG